MSREGRANRAQKQFVDTNQTMDTLRGETIKNHQHLSEMTYDTEVRARNFNTMTNVELERMAGIFFRSKLVVGTIIIALFIFIWNASGTLKWRLLFTLIAMMLVLVVVMVMQTNVEKSFIVIQDQAAQLVFMMRYSCAAKRSSDSQLMNTLLADTRAIRGRNNALNKAFDAVEKHDIGMHD